MINYIKNNIYKILYFSLIIILFDFNLLSIITGLTSLLLLSEKEKKIKYKKFLMTLLFAITITSNLIFNTGINILLSIIGYIILFYFISKNKDIDYKNSIYYWVIPLSIYIIMELTSFNLSKIYNLFSDKLGQNFLLLISFLIIKFSIDLLSSIIGYKLSSLIIGNFMFIISIVNFFTMALIGKPFNPEDIVAAGTALGVISNYSLSFKYIIFLLFLLFLIFIYNFIIIKKYKNEKLLPVNRSRKIYTSIFGLLAIYFLWYSPDNIGTLEYMNENHYGIIMNIINSGFNDFKEPEKYNEFKDRNFIIEKNKEENNNKRPNVIFIMNEAFSDLNVIDNGIDPYKATPFVKEMIENNYGGYAFSSVFGNNTVSSEFESMTGISTALTTKGAKIYNNYINDNIPSIAKILKDIGYSTYGIHPYLSSGYNRVTAWNTLGLDKTIFVDEFEQKDNIRSYVSDKENYEKIIDVINKHDEPVFIFNTTMQNHGGYTENVDLNNKINIGKDIELNNYLSLVKESDDAIKDLINYYKNSEEDIIIVFFGDHQPSLTSFYNKFPDNSSIYKVPYFIWSNCSLNTIELPKEVSLNYLPAIIIETLGLNNNWFNGVYDLMNSYPIISECAYKIGDEDILDKVKWKEYFKSLNYENLNEDEINLKIYESLSYKYIQGELCEKCEFYK